MAMLVLRKTMEAAVEAQREQGSRAVYQLAQSYGEALSRVTALQKQLEAWLMNKAGDITPEQMAQMFYAQDDEWQARFFNCMQGEVQAVHDAMPPARAGGMPRPHAGVPAGEGQWYHMAKHLDQSGFETLEAMFEHARSHRGETERAEDSVYGDGFNDGFGEAREGRLVGEAIELIQQSRDELFDSHQVKGVLMVEDEADKAAEEAIAEMDGWLARARAATGKAGA